MLEKENLNKYSCILSSYNHDNINGSKYKSFPNLLYVLSIINLLIFKYLLSKAIEEKRYY